MITFILLNTFLFIVLGIEVVGIYKDKREMKWPK